jgi:Holliday junction resolvase RusA-like endonuclease
MIITHLGPPIPKARARVTKFGHAYTPKRTMDAEKSLGDAICKAMKEHNVKKFSGPLMVDIVFVFAIPPSWKQGKKDLMFEQPHIQRPDIDNLEKMVLDSCNYAGIWDDDCQVASLTAIKKWGKENCTKIRIQNL